MEGIDRAITLASQAFTALIPILILASTLTPKGDANVVAETMIRKFDLSGVTADAVNQLFTVPEGANGSLSAISILLLLFSGISFTRRMQRMYRAAWNEEKAGVRSALFAALGLLAIMLEATVLYAIRSLVRHLPLNWLIMFPLSFATGVVLWTSIPWLLLNRGIHWRRLVAQGVIASACISVYGIATSIYMPGLIERSISQFGLFGITIAIIGWLLAISMVLVASAAIGAEFDLTRDRWALELKTRFNLRDPNIEAPAATPAATPLSDDLDVEDIFENPFIIGRILVDWLIVAAAVWVSAAIVPGIVVRGGFLTYLWVSLIFGLVNAVLGPILHLIALPFTVFTLGLFALVVNGVLLIVTAVLSDKLDVSSFAGAIVGALVISIATAVLGFVLSPLKKELRQID